MNVSAFIRFAHDVRIPEKNLAGTKQATTSLTFFPVIVQFYVWDSVLGNAVPASFQARTRYLRRDACAVVSWFYTPAYKSFKVWS